MHHFLLPVVVGSGAIIVPNPKKGHQQHGTAFKLEGGQRHHDDATSVAAWVEEMRGMGDDNVVLYYINLKVLMMTKQD